MQTEERIYVIDGLRGFSLFGILIANFLIFQYGIFGMENIVSSELSFLDRAAYAFTKVFVEGSFMPIFTFLFGYSFIIMRDRLTQKQLRVKWTLFRRSLLLIGIGLLHSTFLWEGDILMMYGGMGVLLLIFVNRKAMTTLIWAITISVILIAFSSLPVFIDFEGLNEETLMTDGELAKQELRFDDNAWEAYLEETNAVYATGTYQEIKEHRKDADPLIDKFGKGKLAVVMLLLPFVILPLFLFGMYAAKKGHFTEPRKQVKGYRRLFLITLPAGLGLKLIGFYFGDHASAEAANLIGGPVLAFGYISLFGLIYATGKSSLLLQGFEDIGKMSLTNYLLQTVICTTIFYGYGFGLFGKIGIFYGIILSFLIYSA
ncbi:MAG TPA: DUF418 domain-containing protein, partial [Virgibacillus sp.]|nr:DUF418 domain-containing protein [Virgibacillus sp.]